MDKVWSDELCEEGWQDIGEEDDGFGREGADEIEGCGEDDHVEDVVDEA